jgi:hypothetical protein
MIVAALMVTGLGACAADGAGMDAQISGCLRTAGQDSSLENIDKRRVENPEFNRAFEACAKKYGVKIRPAGEEIHRVDERVLALKRCMEQAGWQMPQPTRGDHGALVWQGMDALVPTDRINAFQNDYQTCESRLGPSESDHDHHGHEH